MTRQQKRTSILAGIAAVLVALVIADQRGLFGGHEAESTSQRLRSATPKVATIRTPEPLVAPTEVPPSAATPPSAGILTPGPSSGLNQVIVSTPPSTPDVAEKSAPVGAGKNWNISAHRYAELKGLQASQEQVESSFREIAGPYSEAIATYQGVFPAGTKPQVVIEREVRGRLPAGVKLARFHSTPLQLQSDGSYSATAEVEILSSDSLALQQAFLDLGNPDNGNIWKSFTLTADAARKSLRLEGQLALRYVEAAE